MALRKRLACSFRFCTEEIVIYEPSYEAGIYDGVRIADNLQKDARGVCASVSAETLDAMGISPKAACSPRTAGPPTLRTRLSAVRGQVNPVIVLENTAGIEQTFGIERVFDTMHEVEFGVALDRFEQVPLQASDPMLCGD